MTQETQRLFLSPVIVKHRRHNVRIDNEEDYRDQEKGERQTRTVTKSGKEIFSKEGCE